MKKIEKVARKTDKIVNKVMKKAEKAIRKAEKKEERKVEKLKAKKMVKEGSNIDPNWPKYERPFYFHFRDDQFNAASNGITVCMKPHRGYEFNVGVACCSKIDNFSRKIGRSIATGRSTESMVTATARNMKELKQQALTIAESAIMGVKRGKKLLEK